MCELRSVIRDSRSLDNTVSQDKAELLYELGLLLKDSGVLVRARQYLEPSLKKPKELPML